MRLLLKILAAPLIVALALLVWICSGLLSIAPPLSSASREPLWRFWA